MGDRKAATAQILDFMDMLLPGSKNREIMQTRLNDLTDEAFEGYMRKLQSGEEVLPLYAPILTSPKLQVERNLKVAKKLGIPLFERIWMTDGATGRRYLTPKTYLVIDLPMRRQQQLLIKKISIPEDNRHVDELTGQPSGPSKGASISFPELQVLSAQGLDRSIEELIKFRGGDTKAFQSMNRHIIEMGGVSQDVIKRSPTKVKSTQTLGVLLKTIHLDNRL